ncbi:DNA helicase UvrD [Candidatus Micrarchaeota archaeon]|nr:DNA helicase UvrD [Candidatus Micrarchaeota archaeon]
MLHFADLHFHSKYSRAVSPDMSLEGLNTGAKVKGLTILGTGDFTHPLWFKELKSRLEADEVAPGFYRLADDADSVRFMLTCEVSTLCSTPAGAKKVHHILHVPDLEQAAQINDVLSKRGNLMADGRPMFGKTMPSELVEWVRSVSKDVVVVPAHVWTPWFSVFGSKSGFDSMDAAYGDQARHIFAYETGISSDPAMNWRVSSLDALTPMSNSDSHSNVPWRLGRECNAFDFSENADEGPVSDALSYSSFWKSVREKDADHFKFTIETPPEYGKYHWDGHRACGFSCKPAETNRLNSICPVCKTPLTIGVEYRVEQLADRPVGFVPKDAIPFKTLLPLHELLSAVLGMGLASKKIQALADLLIQKAGTELDVLLQMPENQAAAIAGDNIARAIFANRAGTIEVTPGFDGEYGVPRLT